MKTSWRYLARQDEANRGATAARGDTNRDVTLHAPKARGVRRGKGRGKTDQIILTRNPCRRLSLKIRNANFGSKSSRKTFPAEMPEKCAKNLGPT